MASEDDKLILHSEQALDPVLQEVALLKEQKQDSEMRVAAVIPEAVAERMMQEGSFNDPAALRRWLNDPQNDCFRVWRGRV